jgi:hypothetical protein
VIDNIFYMSRKRSIIILIFIIIVALVVWQFSSGDSANPESADLIKTTPPEIAVVTSTPASAVEVVATSSPNATPAKQGTKATAPKLTYDQAIKEYGVRGYRIQLSQCHGTPGRLAIKSGTAFMVDNREGVAHTVVLAKQTFKVPAWGFVIIYTQGKGKQVLTCDGGGAAEIDVQP